MQNVSEERKEQILLQILESLEPREAEIILGVFQKDLGVKGLTPDLIREAFPGRFNF